MPSPMLFAYLSARAFSQDRQPMKIYFALNVWLSLVFEPKNIS
jgi:sugar phosphate permease